MPPHPRAVSRQNNAQRRARARPPRRMVPATNRAFWETGGGCARRHRARNRPAAEDARAGMDRREAVRARSLLAVRGLRRLRRWQNRYSWNRCVWRPRRPAGRRDGVHAPQVRRTSCTFHPAARRPALVCLATAPPFDGLCGAFSHLSASHAPSLQKSVLDKPAILQAVRLCNLACHMYNVFFSANIDFLNGAIYNVA